jgi:hypothetical protein
MKKTLFFLVLITVLIISFAPNTQGQTRPTKVDNSAYFGPAVRQFGSGCQVFSLAYLKSYLWNKQFQRDPILLENQFSGFSLWNQSINTFQHYATRTEAILLMRAQGAVTSDRFPEPTNMETLPDWETRESGLRYRSSGLNSTFMGNSSSPADYINKLKDSLIAGNSFTLSFPLFHYINQLYNKQNAVYVCPEGISQDSLYASHAAVVVGYDDNVVTANGKKGAFKLLNSWGPNFGDQGYFFLDYNWFFYANWWHYEICFLEEDFNYTPELALNLDIRAMVSGDDINYMKNSFVDTVYSYWNRRVDYVQDEYFFYSHLLRIKTVNGQVVPSSLESDGSNNTNNMILLPRHNHNGDRQILADLTDYVRADDFKSLELIITDPKSATYIGENGNVVYSYVREAKAEVNDSYIKFLKGNKRIVGRVTNLPDTTVVSRNFYSYPAAYHQTTPSADPILIKQCTSVLRRISITFSIEDANSLPVFTNKADTLKTTVDSAISYQFKASDADGDLLKYSLSTPDTGAKIDSLTGLFEYRSQQPVKKQLEVVVTDGKANVISRFMVEVDNTVGVEDEPGLPKDYSLSQNYPNPFNPSTVISFSLPRSGIVILKVYNIIGQEVASLVNGEMNAGKHQIKFDAGHLASGVYVYQLQTKGFTKAIKMLLTK